MNSPGVVTTGLLKETGWQVVWVAQPTDKTIHTIKTTCSVVSVGHIVGDWGYPTPSPISYAQGRSASLEKLPLHAEVQFRSVPNY